MRQFSYIFLLVAFILLFSGCSKVQVSQDYKPGSNFAGYRQYQWKAMAPVSSEDARVANPLLHERFRQNIDQGLAQRGFAFGAPADFLVNYTYSIQTRLESDYSGSSVGFGAGSHYRYSHIGFGTGVGVRQYDVGVLVIDIYDIPAGKLVWRGTGTEIVGTHSTPEETSAFVYRMVNAILAQFPPY